MAIMNDNNRHGSDAGGNAGPKSRRGPARAQFATRLGVIATTVGSAVGLGNIWRFPYEAGVHGGGAFLVIYLFFIFVVGVPVVTAEFIIGRSSGANVYGAFKALHSHPLWRVVGVTGILASLMILSFYAVVAGWTVDYIFRSLDSFGGESSPAALHEGFTEFSGSWGAVGWTVGFLAMNFLILRRGVQEGIEKMSNIMMPLLFIILLVFCANSLTLPGARAGLEFLLRPDFSKVDTGVLIGAMGQAFFSLSLGLGCLITYASYFNRQTDLLRSATVMASLDTLVALLAGVVIFPAVFTFGGTPEAGPRLVFETLPSLFMAMPWGMVWSTLFFVLLTLASLTSTISMSEISIAYFSEELGMTRTKATTLNTVIAVTFGTLCSLSFGPLREVTVCGLTVFDLFDYVSSNILLPVGGVMISIFAGWVMDRRARDSELVMTTAWRRATVRVVVWCMRVVAPACIMLVFLSGLKVI